LAIFRAADSVDELLKACPLRFSIERIEQPDEPPEEEEEGKSSLHEGLQDIEDEVAPRSSERNGSPRIDGDELLARPSTLVAPPRSPAFKVSDPIRAPNNRPPRPSDEFSTHTEFRVSAGVWLGKQDDYLERSAYWGPFHVDTRSRIQQDLKRRVPMLGLSDIHNFKNYPFLATLRRRQAEMEERMTVRQYYELVQAGDVEKLDAPTNVPGEPMVQDQGGRILTPMNDLLIRPTFNSKRKPLNFAEPPGVHIVDYEEKVAQARQKRRETLEERYGSKSSLSYSSLHNSQSLEDSLPSRFEPPSTPVSEKQYGSLVGLLPPRPRENEVEFSNSATSTLYSSNSEETSAPSPTHSESNKGVGLGAQISSLLGLEAEEPPPKRYSSSVKSHSKKKRSKKRTSEELDPADIEAELRRNDY
jgi:hypothetical protein